MKKNTKIIAGSAAAGGTVLYLIWQAMGRINPFNRVRPGSGSGGSGGPGGFGGPGPDPPGGSGYSTYHKEGFSSSTTERGRFVSSLKSKIGKPYIWGARGPNSFDCSGLVDWAYGTLGIDVPERVTEQSGQAPYSIVFERFQSLNSIKHLLKKGDCIGLDYQQGGRFDHVLVFIGGNKFVHASGREACPCTGSRCKVVKDPLSHFSGTNVRSIYSWA